jgi:hypothetical protein
LSAAPRSPGRGGARRALGPVGVAVAAALAGAALATTGCADLTVRHPAEALSAPIADPSFSRDIQPILTETCASSDACHAGPTPQMGLSLEPGLSYARLVGVPSVTMAPLLRVEPGQPDSSALALRLDTSAAVREGLPRMPRTEYPLPAAVIQTIRNWIANGAPNN